MGNEAENMNQESSQQIKVKAAGIDPQAILSRVKDILISPAAALDNLKRENVSATNLIVGYLLPLAALSFLCTWLGMYFIGLMTFFGGLVYAVAQTAISLVSVYLLAVAINKFLPKLQGQASVDDATKLICFAATPGYIGGMLGLVPPIAVLGIIPGIYSLYLLYLGIPKLLNVPVEKQLPVFGCILLAGALIGFALFATMNFVLMNVFGFWPYRYRIPENLEDALEHFKQFIPPSP